MVTEDGTNQSKVVGIVSEHDLLQSYQDSPKNWFKAVRKAKSVEEIKKIQQKIKLSFIVIVCSILTSFTEIVNQNQNFLFASVFDFCIIKPAK